MEQNEDLTRQFIRFERGKQIDMVKQIQDTISKLSNLDSHTGHLSHLEACAKQIIDITSRIRSYDYLLSVELEDGDN